MVLLHVLHHFLKAHPEVRPNQHEPGAYDIWRDLKVSELLKDGEREQGDDRSRKH